MKIAEIDIIPVAFKEPPLRNSWGVHESYAVRNIVRIKSENGAIGYGETYGGNEIKLQLERYKDDFIGLNPSNIEMLKILMREASPGVISGYEVAMLDLVGKIKSMSISELIGGSVKKEVDFCAYLFFHYAGMGYTENMSVDTMVEETKMFVSKYGFKSLKLKGGVLPPEEEINVIKALRKEFPNHKLRLDPNAVWSIGTAVMVAKELENYLEYLEDPVSGIEGMSILNRKTSLPLATNMCVTEFSHLPSSIRNNAVDIILSDHHLWGGLLASKELAAICKTFNIDISMHSNSHLEISLAAMIHMASTIPNLSYACDTHYIWLDDSDSILKDGKMKIKDGKLAVPKGPGLGVDISDDKIRKLNQQFIEYSVGARDDMLEMRKYEKDWLPLPVRW